VEKGLVDSVCDRTTKEVGKKLERLYLELLAEVNNEGGRYPYNFVLTKDFAMVVLRRTDNYEGIPINSLGFLGMLYMKNDT